MLEIECYVCKKMAKKPKKEIDRQIKKGRTNFFCGVSCAGKSPDNLNHLSLLEKNISGLFAANKSDEYTGLREHLRRARKRDKNTDITLDDLLSVWDKQKGKCVYTKVDLEYPTSGKKTTKNYNYMASLDRVDSNLGYTKNNIQFVSVSCNWLKNNMTNTHMEEFFDIITELRGRNSFDRQM